MDNGLRDNGLRDNGLRDNGLRDNDIVIIERNDLGADRIPFIYRHYINENTYIYRAKIIQICQNNKFHRVKPIPLTDNENDDFIGTRKGYVTKIYKYSLLEYKLYHFT